MHPIAYNPDPSSGFRGIPVTSCRTPVGLTPVNVRSLPFVDSRSPAAGAQLRELRGRVDPGEAEALALALEVQAAAVLIGRTRCARRMLIENGLADTVDFFHLDALSSAVALNVGFDVPLTDIASGVYRIFARSLRGVEAARARQVFRRFLDTTARVWSIGEKSSSTCHVARTTLS